VPPGVLDLLAGLADKVAIPGVMLERDGDFPPTAELDGELDAIARAARRSGGPMPLRRSGSPHRPAFVGRGVRDRLAAEQSALVATLVDRTPALPGFDPVRLGAAAAALAVKRAEAEMTPAEPAQGVMSAQASRRW